MKKYNHAIDFAAEVKNDDESNVTAAEARAALIGRLSYLTDDELLEAVDIYDTCDNEEDETPSLLNGHEQDFLSMVLMTYCEDSDSSEEAAEQTDAIWKKLREAKA